MFEVINTAQESSSIAAYLATNPPAALDVLQQSVNAQQSEIQETNSSWLVSKFEKLHNKCEAVKKAAAVVSSSLSKKMDKRSELLLQRANFIDATTAAVRSKCDAAMFALEQAMIKERDGCNVAPKKKSLHDRLKELEDTRDKILEDKKKLEEKCGKRMVEKAVLTDKLSTHAEEFFAVQGQVHGVLESARKFRDAITHDQDN